MRCVIVGAGIAGLTAGYKLLENGHEVIILEKESEIGGLARTFQYGDFIFDIGPHRFFTHKEEILRFVKFVLKDDYLVKKRVSKLHLFNRYFSWPLGPDTIIKLPPALSLRAVLDLFARSQYEKQDFRSQTVGRYGKTLFELVFKGYTEKFFHIPCEELHGNWLEESVGKAVINKKIKSGSLPDLFKMALNSISVQTEFLYPKRGCGRFAQALGEMITAKGGKIIRNVKEISFSAEGDRIISLRYAGADPGTVMPDRLIYTAPITQLAEALGFGRVDLEYLHSLIYNIEIGRELKNASQWIYFGDSDISFVRLSFPANFAKQNVPAGRGSICVEVTCRGGSPLWNAPDSLKGRIIADLTKVKICREEDIMRVHTEKVPYTYPLYKLNYPEELGGLRRRLERFRNLTCLGRSGEFWYNNMDESINAAFEMAGRL